MEYITELNLACENCTNELKATQRPDGWVDVEPCEHCLKETYDTGYEEGEKGL